MTTTASQTALQTAPQGTIFAAAQSGHYSHRMTGAHIAALIAEQRAAKLAAQKTGGRKLYFFATA